MIEFIHYKNIRVAFSSEGKGRAIILLHGFLEDLSMWNHIAPKLSKKNRVICIDLLGHGKTPCLGYVHTMEDQANMVHAVLRHLRLRKYVFVGHSMGGYIALAYAKLFPNTVKGLCLQNTTFKADDKERKKLRLRAIKMAQENYQNVVRMSFMNLFSEHSRTTYKQEIKKALQTALQVPLQSYIASQEGMFLREDSTNFYAKKSFYKTILIGKKDTTINTQILLDFAKKHQVTTAVFSEGHMSHLENKQELLLALKCFVKNC